MTNIAALAEMDGEQNQTYPQWTTTSEAVKYGTARPLLFELEMHCFISFLLESDKNGIIRGLSTRCGSV